MLQPVVGHGGIKPRSTSTLYGERATHGHITLGEHGASPVEIFVETLKQPAEAVVPKELPVFIKFLAVKKNFTEQNFFSTVIIINERQF